MRRVMILLALCCAACSTRAPAPAPMPSHADARPRVVLSRPEESHVLRLPVALAEIAGAALTPDAERHDLVLALDFSSSAFEPTGRDVDADGVVGTAQPWRPSVGSQSLEASPLEWTTDPDDSVAGVELAAARTLLPRLDAATTRIALLSFGSGVTVLSPLHAPDAALASLEGAALAAHIGGTNVALALARAARLLETAPDPRTRRSILLVTDGYPNLPPPQRRAESAISEQAEELAAAGIRVHVLAIASERLQPRPVLEELSRVTGGSFVSIDDPTELPVWLANTSLAPVTSVEVRNATTGAAALALRLLPDGRFDAFVPLAPGENWIEVRAHAAAGPSEPVRRRLLYEPPPAGAGRVSPEVTRMLDTLRQRTLELELLRELRERRQQQRRELRIEPERN